MVACLEKGGFVGAEEEGRVSQLPAPTEDVAALSPTLATEIEAARVFRAAANSANTRRPCSSDWRNFQDLGWRRDLTPLPARPEVVATYLAALTLAGRADSIVSRRQAAIASMHRQGAASPIGANLTVDGGNRFVIH